MVAFLASSAFAGGACTSGSTTSTGADGGLLVEAGADSSCTLNCGGSPDTCRENTVGTDCSCDSQCASGNCSGSPNVCQ